MSSPSLSSLKSSQLPARARSSRRPSPTARSGSESLETPTIDEPMTMTEERFSRSSVAGEPERTEASSVWMAEMSDSDCVSRYGCGGGDQWSAS